MMAIKSTLTTIALVLFYHANAQMKVVKMPPQINLSGVNNSAPFISLDGRSLVFVSDNTEDNILKVFYSSTSDGVSWKEPVVLSKAFNSPLNFLRGYGLSADGRQLFVSSTKGGGLGGYDLYVSELAGSYWAEPTNVGQPVNSKENEACPSMTTDGLQVFFMRCEKMDAQKASGCKLWMATRRSTTSRWNPPVELPGNVNTGNSQAPRIMADGETLIFASDKLPGKGAMDLFITRRNGDVWSQPTPLDFVNTPGDNLYVSATSMGRYLMIEQPGKSTTELVELLFPPEIKPKGVMKLEGHVSGLTPPTAAYISLFDRDADVRVTSVRPDVNGAFILYLKEGMRYSVAVDPEQDTYTFYSKDFDLTTGRVNTLERLDAKLKRATGGDEIVLDEVIFKPQTAELETSSKRQLDRVVRLLKSDTTKRFAIEVSLYGYQRDSIQSSPDLTEAQHDTIHYTLTTVVTDSLGAVTEVLRDSSAVKTTYHNDRTVQQALEVVNYLIAQGVPSSGVMPESRAFDAIPEERKTLVKLKVR